MNCWSLSPSDGNMSGLFDCLQRISSFVDHHFFAGIWEIYRKLHEDEPRMLQNLCAQAHKISNKTPGAINVTQPAIRLLQFHDSKKYQHIRFDLLIYTIWNHTAPNGMPICYYLTKGLTQDCVYYAKLIEEDEDQESLMLDEHVCGIII